MNEQIHELSHEQLVKIQKHFESWEIPETSKSYMRTYPEFLEYFKNINTIEEHHFIIGASFTYSWMPKILSNLDTENIQRVLEILNNAKKESHLSEKDLEVLKSSINNSIIGVSKLLHFINPEVYPIYDSNVFRFLTDEKPHDYRVNVVQAYLKYQQLCNNCKIEGNLRKVMELIKSKIKNGYKYDISNLRALEIVFFEAGRSMKKEVIK